MNPDDDPRRDAAGETMDPARLADRTPTRPWASADAPIVDQAMMAHQRHEPRWGSAVANALVLLAGVWLVVAPFALGYPAWNDVVVGVLLAATAVPRVLRPASTPWLGVAQVALGIWLIAAPSVLGLDGRGEDVDVVTGIAVVALAGATTALAFAGRGPRRTAVGAR